MRRVLLLGSTGSIGVQALDVLAATRAGDDLELVEPARVVGLAAGSRWKDVLAQASGFDVGAIHLADAGASARARDAIDGAGGTIHVCGSVVELIERCEPDLVLNAIVGFDGLEATLACLERGIDVALANKESLVAAGALCTDLADRTGASIIPVDSEHSALQQCLWASVPEEVEQLVLTASGGPFRGRSRAELDGVTVEQALAHPTWAMGGKITIDSATLMNKGLELIEAMVLFGLPEDRVEVVVNPTSIVHALVRHRDQSLVAHLGWPDMRVPIAWALHHPVRPPLADVRRLDLWDMPPLSFERPDLDTFRCLALARAAARDGGGAPCVLNAANEVAVAAFLAGRLPFLGIEDVVEAALGTIDDRSDPASLDEARDLDARSRAAARNAIG